MSCQQCEDAPCVIGCPAKALSRNMEMGRVEVDYEKCIGCRTCVSVCPFGAMHFVPSDRKVIKCDLCDGDPQCVRFCDVKAVSLVEAGRPRACKRERRSQTASGGRSKSFRLWCRRSEDHRRVSQFAQRREDGRQQDDHLDFTGQPSTNWSTSSRGNMGKGVQQFLLDDTGHLDMSLAVSFNKQEWVRHGPDEQTLCDGDA